MARIRVMVFSGLALVTLIASLTTAQDPEFCSTVEQLIRASASGFRTYRGHYNSHMRHYEPKVSRDGPTIPELA